MSRWLHPEEQLSDKSLYQREWLKSAAGEEYKKKHSEYMKEWRRKNPDKRKAIQQKSYETIRMEALRHYSGKEVPECRCCGETMIPFLHLDHINADGSKQKRLIKETTGRTLNGGTAVMYWLKSQGWPSDIQVLCANCNLGKRTNKYCPHEIARGVDMSGLSIPA